MRGVELTRSAKIRNRTGGHTAQQAQNGTKMADLGALDGAHGSANWVNDADVVAGGADLPDGAHRGFLWKDGHMRDLPPPATPPCTNGNAVNNLDEVTGNITDCHGDELVAVLWSLATHTT
jgi:uncharacterized membrane protein